MTWRVECGDCRSLFPLIEPESVSLVVTDPPYSSGGQFRGDRAGRTRDKYQQSDVVTEHAEFSGDNRDQRSWIAWMSLWLEECKPLCVPGCALLMFCDWRQLPSASDAIQAGGWCWRGIVPWNKVVARPVPDRPRAQCEYVLFATKGPREMTPTEESEYLPGFFEFTIPQNDSRDHPTQKPVELLQELVRLAPRGGLVFDPFCGSGTTGVACVQRGRRFIGCELEPHYAAIAKRRISEAVPALFTPEAVKPAPGLF